MIEFKNVSKTYKNGTHALYDINLRIDDGEFVYIIGPTGSGKSTLIKHLDGELIPTRGSVIVGGVDVGRLKKSKVYLYRRTIGVVFQDCRLLPEKTVFENVAYALEILDWPKEAIVKRVREVLKLVDLSDKSHSKFDELSGGQIQRVAIARAIAKRPRILIADEPTGNLDPKMTDEIVKMFERINEEEKTTILIVTHDNVMIEKHPKRLIVLDAGHISEDHPASAGKEVFDKTLEVMKAKLAEEVRKLDELDGTITTSINKHEPDVLEMIDTEPEIFDAEEKQ